MIVSSKINVVYGAHDLDMDLAGLTVEEIQFSLQYVLNVDMEAEAYLDGNLIEDKTINVVAGQRLEFMQLFGIKGVGQTWTKEEFMRVFHMREADWSDWVARGLPFDTMQDGTVIVNETEVDRWKAAQRGQQPENHAVLERLAGAAEEIAHSLASHPTGHPALTEDRGFNATVEAEQQRSPYLDADEAARYLGISVKSLYGVVERRHLIPLRGPRRAYRFTVEMLDEYLKRR
jgi:excisionase family DNA binding protein